MFIRMVEDGLEKLLRDELPLPPQAGEISFDAPTRSWSAQLSRLTVNLFLYDVGRSSQPSRTAMTRTTESGQAERRPPLPMVVLSYLVSAWAGSTRDEHQLLGDVINRLSGRSTLEPRYLPSAPAATVSIGFGADPNNRTREIWSAVGSELKASFTVHLTVGADAFDWTDQAPRVERIEALTAPMPAPRSP